MLNIVPQLVACLLPVGLCIVLQLQSLKVILRAACDQIQEHLVDVGNGVKSVATQFRGALQRLEPVPAGVQKAISLQFIASKVSTLKRNMGKYDAECALALCVTHDAYLIVASREPVSFVITRTDRFRCIRSAAGRRWQCHSRTSRWG